MPGEGTRAQDFFFFILPPADKVGIGPELLYAVTALIVAGRAVKAEINKSTIF